ncbi:hypothetical protein [Mycetocola sp. 2940]|uniref:hypothetical protein n=1 Tax=Mycetocola sp. 2940 TaxID=3156452 RepID=UPI003396F0AD
MRITLALLPSPLLGPAAWAAVGAVLVERGWPVVIPPAFRRIRNFHDVLAHWDRALPDSARYVLVPHSNAGLYVPALGERRDVGGAVFVDAALPPMTGSAPLARPAMHGMLARLADATGTLPPWSEWWSDADLTGLFPDAATRDAVAAEQVRLPLSYFDGRIPVAPGWSQRPSAYLAFGDTYARERRAAAHNGWPVRTLPGGHLLMLTEPERVASAVEELVGSLRNTSLR